MSNAAIITNHKEIPYSSSGIYIIIDKENKPLYIGSSTNLRIRLYEHFRGASHIKQHKEEISRALIITHFSNGLEKYAIMKYKPRLNGFTFVHWTFTEKDKYESILKKVDDLWIYEE